MFSFARFADTAALVAGAALSTFTGPVTRGSLANVRDEIRRRSADSAAAEGCLQEFLDRTLVADRAFWA